MSETIEDKFYGTAERMRSQARKLLYRASKPVEPVDSLGRPIRKRVLCACGQIAAYPVIVRDKQRVCEQCAKKTPASKGGRPVVSFCRVCHKPTGRHAGAIRFGLLICKKCAVK